MKNLMLLLVTCLLPLAGCGGGSSRSGGGGNNGPTLQSIQVTGLGGSVVAGQQIQLKATANYSDSTSADVTSTAVWSSSDSNIAAVAAGGMLTAKASGQCSVSAKVGAVGGSASVSVTPALVSISVTPANSSMAASTAQQFIATGTYSDNSTQNLTTQVSWASSNTSIATVSTTAPTKGLVLALSAGPTTISATLGSVSGGTLLTVTTATVTAITITPSDSSLALGLSQQYTAMGTFSDNSNQDITNVVQWHSSISSVASITVSGLATARAIGTTTISATFEGVMDEASLAVSAANVSSIAISPASGSIAQGTQKSFVATGTYNDGSTHDLTRTVTWSSDNTGALTIGPTTGLAKGIAAGQANVTATLGSLTATVPFTVTNATIVSIALTPGGQTIPTGGRTVFAAIGTFSDSSTQNLTSFAKWSSDNTAIATAGNGSNAGVTVGVSTGVANISAIFTYAGASATGSAPLTVSTATLSSITMNPTTAVLAPGSAVGIAAYGNFSDSTVEWINPLCTWTSSNNAVATVSPNGLVFGQSAGVVTITATDGPITGTATVLVESAALSSLQVNPPSRSVPVGFSTSFSAIGTFANGDIQNLTNFANWTSSSSSTATISNAASTTGFATGVQPGTTTISALFSGQVGTATLTVTNATLVSITLTPSSATIAPGGSQSFTATGNFSDGSTLDITRQVSWASFETPIATVSSVGLAQGISSGTATISATVNGVSGTALLTVQ